MNKKDDSLKKENLVLSIWRVKYKFSLKQLKTKVSYYEHFLSTRFLILHRKSSGSCR